MTNPIGPTSHVISLASKASCYFGDNGSISQIDASDLPMMRRLSIRRLLLERDGIRAPHWHANAHELGYCVAGLVLVTIAGNHAERESFEVGAGAMFFIPSGAMHSIANLSSERAEIILAFSHEKPEDFEMKSAYGAMSDAVLGNTYSLNASDFSWLDRSTPGPRIVPLGPQTTPDQQGRHINSNKYSLEATPPQIDNPAGTAHIARGALWPALRDIAMFSVVISDEGMREPHWHPETAEMGYVVSGSARMTILDPEGNADTYRVNPGDAYFIPRAYPHHIENMGEGGTHLLIFFDQTSPGDIGYRTLINVFSREQIAATLGVEPSALPLFPFTENDPLLVSRTNPVEPA